MNQHSLIAVPDLRLDELILPDRVHTRLYMEKEIFDQEIERIFHGYWLFIGHASEIPDAGDFRQRQMGTQPVIFVRGQDGKVRVLMNRCTHRANAVCQQARGNAPGFTCPYHGWRFRLDGELAAVPYADRYGPEFDKSKLGLTPVPRLEEYRGFVFASLNPNVCSLDEHFGPLVKQELDDICDLSPEGEIDASAGYHHLKIRANWKLAMENVIDGYHANFAHRSYFDAAKRRTGVDPAPLGSSSSPATVHIIGNGHATWDSRTIIQGIGKFAALAATEVGRAYIDAMHKAHGEERTEYVLAKQGSHLFIFPNFSYTGAHYRRYTPLAADSTRLTLFPFMLKGAPEEYNIGRLRAHEQFYGPCALGGQSDDIEVFERNQMGINAELAPWSLLSRGMHLEKQMPDGSIANQITDELFNRAFFARYKEVMSA